MSLAQGFAQGFGMMDQYYARQDAQQFRDQQAQTEQQRYGAQMERQQKQDQLAEQQHRLDLMEKGVPTYDDGTPNFGLHQQQLDQQRIADARAAQQKAALDAAKIRADIAKSEAEVQAKYASANKSQADAEKIQSELKAKTAEDRNKLVATLLQLHEQDGYQFTEEDMAAIMDSSFGALMKHHGTAVESMRQDFIKAESMEDDLQLIEYMNSPKMLTNVNRIFGTEIYEREKTNPGKKYRIIKLDVINGGIVPEFEVTDAKTGSVISTGPATVNRSTSADDFVQPVPVHLFKDKIAQTFRILDSAKTIPELNRYFTGGSEKGIVLGSNSMLVDPVTGVVRAENTRSGLTPRDIYTRVNAIEKMLGEDDYKVKPEQKTALMQERDQLLAQLPQQLRGSQAFEQPTPNQSTNAPRNNAGQNAAMGVGSQDMIQLLEQLKAEGKI
jgi:hypothetical protein